MAVVRRNVVTNLAARAAYIRGVKLLKQENTSATTTSFTFPIPGPVNPINTYDLFVIWHFMAMNSPVPPGTDPLFGRNAAHSGPVFLPWHRLMLSGLEVQLQRVLNDPNFGLPYWDWAVDASLVGGPQSSLIWQNQPDTMGGQGTPISTGPLVFNNTDPTSFRVLIESSSDGRSFHQTKRGLNRTFGQPPPLGSSTLPTATEVLAAFNTLPEPLGEPHLATYDFAPFDRSSNGFRNRLEGWPGGVLHNRVHQWVGGDMGPATSPNDPVFFLHHCNVDRIWERWMQLNGRNYLPDMTAPPTLLGHRIDDALISPFGLAGTPRSQLDTTTQYTYDVIP